MWETLHLFSRYAKDYSISSTSSIENTVSAYSSINNAADSMTVIIVNRDMSAARNVTVNLNNFGVGNGNYTTLQLASLPSTETFVSHTNNALKTSTVAVTSNSFTLTVPSLSVTAVILKSATTDISAASMMDNQESVVAVYNQSGQKVSTDMSTLGNGVYMILFNNGKGLSCKKVMIQK
jgi:phenylalanyl-tRNA synthetase beta subunit